MAVFSSLVTPSYRMGWKMWRGGRDMNPIAKNFFPLSTDGIPDPGRLNGMWEQHATALRHKKERIMTARNTTILTLAALVLVWAGPFSAAFARGQGMGMGEGGPPFAMQFDVIDADKDGKITVEEVTLYRQSKVAGTDANADGKLSADEIAAQEVRLMTDRATLRAKEMVVRFDTDGDGLLSAEELASRPMPDRLFDRLDADGDGALSKEEVDAGRKRMAESRGEGRGGWKRDWGMSDKN
jgi:hypothetical protein